MSNIANGKNTIPVVVVIPGFGSSATWGAGALDETFRHPEFYPVKILAHSLGGVFSTALAAGHNKNMASDNVRACLDHLIDHQDELLRGFLKAGRQILGAFPLCREFLLQAGDVTLDAYRSYTEGYGKAPLVSCLREKPDLFRKLTPEDPTVIVSVTPVAHGQNRLKAKGEAIELNQLATLELQNRALAASGNVAWEPSDVFNDGRLSVDGGWAGIPDFAETVEECTKNKNILFYFLPNPLDAAWRRQDCSTSIDADRALFHAIALEEIALAKDKLPEEQLVIFAPQKTQRDFFPGLKTEMCFDKDTVEPLYAAGARAAAIIIEKEFGFQPTPRPEIIANSTWHDVTSDAFRATAEAATCLTLAPMQVLFEAMQRPWLSPWLI